MKSLIKDIKALSKNMTYIILAGLLLFALSGGTALIQQSINDYTGSETPETPSIPDTVTPAIPDSSIRAALGKWRIRDALTKTATAVGDAAYVGIIKADANGNFDPLDPQEETEFADTDPDIGATTYSIGDSLVIAVSSDNDPTSGDETYPRWFYVESLDHNAIIYAFNLANPISSITQTKSGTTYTFTVNKARCEDTGYRVAWLEGTTSYWDFKTFEVYGRVAKASVIQQITAGGVVLTTFSDGATWEDTDGEINANHTMTSDKEDLDFQMIGEANDVAWGLPYLMVGANGLVSQYNAVLIVTTDALGINVAELYDDGWQPINKPDLTDDLGFYYVITTEGLPRTGEKFSISVPFTVEDSGLTASTEYEVEGWAFDCQKLDNVARGSTTASLPGNNGFISDPGLDTVLQALALTVSSGSAATMQSMTHFTTNA